MRDTFAQKWKAQPPEQRRQTNNYSLPTPHVQIQYSDALKRPRPIPKEKQMTQTRAPMDRNLKDGSKGMVDLKQVLTELKINQIIALKKFAALLQQIKTELKDCNSTMDKLMVPVRYIAIFN